MSLSFKSDLGHLKAKLAALQTISRQGSQWAEGSAKELDTALRDNLATQRRGKNPPTLSSATLKTYGVDGQPHGSAIRDHLETFHQHSASQSTSGVGIPQGKPAIAAKVQTFGATIRVTDKMRGYLAAKGIFLKPSTKAIRIPARGFWTRSWRTAKQSRFARLKKLLKP